MDRDKLEKDLEQLIQNHQQAIKQVGHLEGAILYIRSLLQPEPPAAPSEDTKE